MTELRWLLVAMVLFLAALPALSLGTDGDVPALWVAGLVLVAVAGAIPVVLRFAPSGGED
ncbi:hypothetical protein [Micromonospora craniellae]|uniref:Uncharacterized protein n=1 Tax=Micromonospora craniellae TaxID=2294034 RepID=A0A372G293_9ACTN|nr:hypothetical protein [Micromonospora craniellae]QOC91062.1 hypothetical protein ID554_23905 [Micromonospora craniellae]RFS47187.1 hypothetical protein D0Q02_06345 [Micromonospora craniellae]